MRVLLILLVLTAPAAAQYVPCAQRHCTVRQAEMEKCLVSLALQASGHFRLPDDYRLSKRAWAIIRRQCEQDVSRELRR